MRISPLLVILLAVTMVTTVDVLLPGSDLTLDLLVPSMYCTTDTCYLQIVAESLCSMSCKTQEGSNYVCLEDATDSSVKLPFCLPNNLECPAGYQGAARRHHNERTVVLTCEGCPENEYKRQQSKFLEPCKTKKAVNSRTLPESFRFFSNGNSTTPSQVCCNAELGYYSKDGIESFIYDEHFGNLFNTQPCRHISEENPCCAGKHILPDGSCTPQNISCKDLEAEETTPTKPSKGKETEATSPVTRTLGITIGISMVIITAVAGVLYCCRGRRYRNNRNWPRYSQPNTTESGEGLLLETFKKMSNWLKKRRLHRCNREHNLDTAENEMAGTPFRIEDHNDPQVSTADKIQRLHQQMEKVGCVLVEGRLVGTSFRVGTKYLLTAFHVIKGVIEKYIKKTGSLEFVDGDVLMKVRVKFGKTVSCGPELHVVCCYILRKSDVALLTLALPGENQTDLPQRILLEENTTDVNEVAVIGYGNKKKPDEKTLEDRRKIILPTDPLFKTARKFVDKNWQHFKTSTTNTHAAFLEEYDQYTRHSDCILYNDGYLEQGVSGAPLLICQENYIQAIAVVLGANVSFYYDLPANVRNKFPDEYVFFVAVKMSRIQKELKELRVPELDEVARDIFRSEYSIAEC